MRHIATRRAWSDELLKWSFWGLNGGLAAMAVFHLIPAGFYQMWFAVKYGLWYARSPEIAAGPVIRALTWGSTLPHLIFAAGAFLLLIFLIRAIRGQLEGPISFGFNIQDQDERPILFDDTVRPFMLDFMVKRLNVQLARLKECNRNAFMFVDEPGLQFLFSAMSGYSDLKAKADLDQFFAQVERPRGILLCGNPDWDFLLNLDLDVLSLDVYTNKEARKPPFWIQSIHPRPKN